MPKVSIIIPTYNRKNLLPKAVESVLTQNYNDYELIICDNHSNDGTKEYCKNLSKKNSRIKYHRNSKNLGMVGNWNTGLSIAKGKYVNILMDDDELLPGFLKETITILESNRLIGFVVTHILYSEVNESGKAIIDKKKSNKYKLHLTHKLNTGEYGLKRFLYKKLKIGLPSGILFRKNESIVFNEYGLDPGFWLEYCDKYQHYYYLNKSLCLKKVHDGDQFTSTKQTKKNLRRSLHNVNNAFNFLLVKEKMTQKIEKQYFKYILELKNQMS